MLEIAESRLHSVAIEYFERLRQVLALVPGEELSSVVDVLLSARLEGRRVYVIGNGGSAATASHFVCDLVKTAQVPGHRALRAFALADNTPMFTAVANDHDYRRTFADQIQALVEHDDVVIAMSVSGSSPNIVDGLAEARARGARTLALVGFDGGAASRVADLVVHVPSYDYGLVEDTHAAIGHAVTAAIRTALLAHTGD